MDLDSYDFEELDSINDAELRGGLWELVCIYFKKRKIRDQALE